MSERLITARFARLEQAEEAASKLKALRARDVAISPWSAGDRRTDEGSGTAGGEFGVSGDGLSAATALAFPPLGAVGTISAIGYANFLPFDDEDDYPPTSAPTRGFLLTAVLDDAGRGKAARIIREAGGEVNE